jgi:DNA-binding LytR/AlgR family response regulator
MEIKIAICDDEEQQAQLIKSMVSEWAAGERVNILPEMFSGAESFKAALLGGRKYDILLLDIQMQGQNGVDLARELRLADEKLIIIFLTALPDFISEGYDVSALHYLVKPVDAGKLRAVLNKAHKKMAIGGDAVFLRTEGESIRVPIDEIKYIESFDHFLEVSALEKKYTVKMPMYELESKLGSGFIRCHRCYAVNLKFVKKITKSEITLDSNEVIPLSRRLYAEANRAMIKYFTEGKNI